MLAPYRRANPEKYHQWCVMHETLVPRVVLHSAWIHQRNGDLDHARWLIAAAGSVAIDP